MMIEIRCIIARREFSAVGDGPLRRVLAQSLREGLIELSHRPHHASQKMRCLISRCVHTSRMRWYAVNVTLSPSHVPICAPFQVPSLVPFRFWRPSSMLRGIMLALQPAGSSSFSIMEEVPNASKVVDRPA